MWIALFSQTGSEIVNLSNKLKNGPDIILTNNADRSTWHEGIEKLPSNIYVMTPKEIVSTLLSYQPCLVTLHGYLRILPAEVCDHHTVINGHPGDIVLHPELKGKDPQKKALELGLESTGVVLHQAIAEVDAGEIITRAYYPIPEGCTEEQLINNLKYLQLVLWEAYMRGEGYADRN